MRPLRENSSYSQPLITSNKCIDLKITMKRVTTVLHLPKISNKKKYKFSQPKINGERKDISHDCREREAAKTVENISMTPHRLLLCLLLVPTFFAY